MSDVRFTQEQFEDVISTGGYVFIGNYGENGYIYQGTYPDNHRAIINKENGLYRLVASYTVNADGKAVEEEHKKFDKIDTNLEQEINQTNFLTKGTITCHKQLTEMGYAHTITTDGMRYVNKEHELKTIPIGEGKLRVTQNYPTPNGGK